MGRSHSPRFIQIDQVPFPVQYFRHVLTVFVNVQLVLDEFVLYYLFQRDAGGLAVGMVFYPRQGGSDELDDQRPSP